MTFLNLQHLITWHFWTLSIRYLTNFDVKQQATWCFWTINTWYLSILSKIKEIFRKKIIIFVYFITGFSWKLMKLNYTNFAITIFSLFLYWDITPKFVVFLWIYLCAKMRKQILHLIKLSLIYRYFWSVNLTSSLRKK